MQFKSKDGFIWIGILGLDGLSPHNNRHLETGRLGDADPPQIFVNVDVDLLPIENDTEEKKIAKKHKLLQIPGILKLLVTLISTTSCNV